MGHKCVYQVSYFGDIWTHYYNDMSQMLGFKVAEKKVSKNIMVYSLTKMHLLEKFEESMALLHHDIARRTDTHGWTDKQM